MRLILYYSLASSGRKKERAHDRETRVLCAHYFQAPAAQVYTGYSLPNRKHRQAKVRCFLDICLWTASFIAQIWSSENVSVQDAVLAPVAKH